MQVRQGQFNHGGLHMRLLGVGATLAALVGGCAVLAGAGSAEVVPARPRNVVMAGPTGTAPGDSLRYTLSWGAGARASSYGVRVTAAGSTGWSGLPNGTTTASTSQVFTAINTTAWDTVRFTARVWSLGVGGRPSRDTASVSWSLVRGPAGPGPITVDSSQIPQLSALDLRPASVTLAAYGDTTRLCPIFVMRDGAVGTASRLPGCTAQLDAAYPVPARRVTVAQQAYIDTTCINYSAPDGGTLTPETACGASVRFTAPLTASGFFEPPAGNMRRASIDGWTDEERAYVEATEQALQDVRRAHPTVQIELKDQGRYQRLLTRSRASQLQLAQHN